jgi:septum formation protein
MRVVLASKSPRRHELFKKLCRDFEIRDAEVAEIYLSVKPHAVVKELARLKARAAATTGADAFIVAADTIVFFNGTVLGKPSDKNEAFSMLKSICGKRHTVYTGVCFKTASAEHTFYDKTYVRLRALSDAEIRAYIDKYQPLDKAGAYGVQDGVLVESFVGCYDNIMGFPTAKAERVLREIGADLNR